MYQPIRCQFEWYIAMMGDCTRKTNAPMYDHIFKAETIWKRRPQLQNRAQPVHLVGAGIIWLLHCCGYIHCVAAGYDPRAPVHPLMPDCITRLLYSANNSGEKELIPGDALVHVRGWVASCRGAGVVNTWAQGKYHFSFLLTVLVLDQFQWQKVSFWNSLHGSGCRSCFYAKQEQNIFRGCWTWKEFPG